MQDPKCCHRLRGQDTAQRRSQGLETVDATRKGSGASQGLRDHARAASAAKDASSTDDTAATGASAECAFRHYYWACEIYSFADDAQGCE